MISKGRVMLAKLSVDQVLMKARSHAKKGDVAEAKKLYQSVLQVFSKNKRAQQGLATLNSINNKTHSLSQVIIDQLVGLYNQGQFSAVVEQAQVLTKQYPDTFIIWNILGVSAVQIDMRDQAIEAFKKVISLKPRVIQVVFKNIFIKIDSYIIGYYLIFRKIYNCTIESVIILF